MGPLAKARWHATKASTQNDERLNAERRKTRQLCSPLSMMDGDAHIHDRSLWAPHWRQGTEGKSKTMTDKRLPAIMNESAIKHACSYNLVP